MNPDTNKINLERLLGIKVKIDAKGMKTVDLSDVKKSDMKRRGVHVKRLQPTYFMGDLVYGEYRNMSRIYGAAPEYVSSPHALIVDKKGQYVGYLSEKIEGEDLEKAKMKLISPREAREIRSQIIYAVEALHSKGIGHGDLDYSNIIKYKKGGHVYIKLLDPAPSLRRKDDERNIKEDRKWIESMVLDYWADKDPRFGN